MKEKPMDADNEPQIVCSPSVFGKTQPNYSHDIAPADLKSKMALKEQSFELIDPIANSKRKKLWQRGLQNKGEYFEGKRAV